jgi:ribose transport system permease protein
LAEKKPENKIESKRMMSSNMKNIFRTTEFTIISVVIFIAIVMSFVTPNFATAFNIGTLIRQISFITIVAYGQTLVLITAGIDLSVGAVAALCAMVSSWLMINTSIDAYLCIVIGIALGALLGAFNGFFIAKVKINAFIITLTAGEIFAGFVMVLTKGRTIVGIPEKAVYLGQGMVGPIPLPVIYMIVIGIVLAYILRNTPFGRFIYSIGDNETAARLVGIKVDKIKIIVYMLSSSLASFAGIMFILRLSTGQPSIGAEWLLPSVTAAILGGTSLSGGQGGIVGTTFGAALMGILANAIVLLNVSPYWQRVVIGTVVLMAVVFDQLRTRRQLTT